MGAHWPSGASAELLEHEADTLDVHGIANTAELATQADLAAIELTPGPAGPQGDPGPAGAAGAAGAAGPQGLMGPVGLPGPAGADGADGAAGAQGPPGADGAPGAAGAPGEKWYSQAGAPANGTGIVGDWSVNLTNGDVYEKTGAAVWTLRGNIKGPQGDAGAAGAAGAAGPAGPQGVPGPTVAATVAALGAVKLSSAPADAANPVAVETADARMTNARPPNGAAGGVLGGNFPAPTFAVDMATQAELDAEVALRAAGDTSVGAPNTQAANYALVLADAGKSIEMNLATALVLTVPTNAAVAFPIGTIIEVCRLGAGAVTIAAAGGVTIRSKGGLLAISGQYSTVSLRKRAADEWVLVGDLA